MESFFQVRQARNHVTSLEDRTRDIESQIGNIRSTISEIRQNIRHREIQIEENESNLVQTGNERFIKMIEKENYLLDQARIKARPVALLGGHCLRQLVSSTAPCGIRTKWPSERRTPFYLATFYRMSILRKMLKLADILPNLAVACYFNRERKMQNSNNSKSN